jgi:hypothetical protein
LIAIPLFIMAVIIIRDMGLRSTRHNEAVAEKILKTGRGRQVEFLRRQIEVTAGASASYFEDMVRARLIDLLVNRASLEWGLEREEVIRIMSDSNKWRMFLKNDELYRLLYSPILEQGGARIAMIKKAVDLIEAWNP